MAEAYPSSAYPRPAPLTSEQADQMQHDAMLGPSPGGGQMGQAQMPMTRTANVHELEYYSGWTSQAINLLQEYQPWNIGAGVNDILKVLKGKGQKGSGGRNEQHQGVFDQGQDVLNDLRFPEDLDVVEGTTFATPVPIQNPPINDINDLCSRVGQTHNALQECKTQDISGRFGKMRGVNQMVIEPTMASAHDEEQLRVGNFRVLSDNDALRPARACEHVRGGDHHDAHQHARDTARSVNPDDVRIMNASYASPPPRPRRTHSTPGAYSSSGTPWHPPSHQLKKYLDDVMLTPTRGNRPFDHDKVRSNAEDRSSPNIRVRDRVAACERNIKQFDREINSGPEFAPSETERFDINDEDDRVREGDGSEWYQQYPRRDEGKHGRGEGRGNNKGGSEGGSYIAGVSEWPRRTRATHDYRDRGDEMSVV
jgi:hypothetical protein